MRYIWQAMLRKVYRECTTYGRQCCERFTNNAQHVSGNAEKEGLQTMHNMCQAMLKKKVYKQCTTCVRQCWKRKFTNNALHVLGNAITWTVSVIKGDNRGAGGGWTLHNLSQDKKRHTRNHRVVNHSHLVSTAWNQTEYNTGLPFLRSPPRGQWSTITDGCKLSIYLFSKPVSNR